MSIDPRASGRENVLRQNSFIVRMSGLGASHGFLSSIGNEGFLSCDRHEFPMGLWQDFRPMRLQPVRIAACLLFPGAVASDLDWIRQLFDNNFGFGHGVLG